MFYLKFHLQMVSKSYHGGYFINSIWSQVRNTNCGEWSHHWKSKEGSGTEPYFCINEYKACFRHRATAVPNLIDWIKLDFSMAVARRLKSSRANAVPNLVDKLLTH